MVLLFPVYSRSSRRCIAVSAVHLHMHEEVVLPQSLGRQLSIVKEAEAMHLMSVAIIL